MALSTDETHITTLLDLGVARQAGLTLYTHEERSKPTHLSYSELRTLVTQKADLLRRCEGIVPGKIVLIHFQSHLEAFTWFWASILAGCVPALSPSLVNNSEGRVCHFKHLHSLLHDPVVITSQALVSSDFAENDILRLVTVETIQSLRRSKSEVATHCKNDRSVSVLANGHPNGLMSGNAEETSNGSTDGLASDLISSHTDVSTNGSINGVINSQTNSHTSGVICSLKGVAVVMFTSGSTGNAKAVCLTHKQLLTAIRGKLSSMPLPQGSALLNWIALDHVASLVEIHLCAMFAGLDQVHIPAIRMLWNPLLFLRLLSEHSVSRTFAPNFFLHKLQSALGTASAQETQNIDLHRLLYIASGGEPNKVDTCARITDHLVGLGVLNKNIITPGFGMTEICGGAIFNRMCPGIDIQAGREFAALGTCVPGIDMRISPIDHAGSRTTHTSDSPGAEGALEIRGPIVFEKYFNDDEATRDAFTPDGWFKTGDLAAIDASGDLKLVGRSKELIIINGVKYLPHELEDAIDQANITGVAQSFVACFAHRPSGSNTEGIYVVYQHEYDTNNSEARMETLHSIIRTVVLFAGARPHVLPLPSGRLDKTTLGKLSRAKIQASLLQGQYKDQEALNTRMLQSCRDANFSEPRDDIERTLMTIFRDTLSLDSLEMGIDSVILDTGVSSVDLIRLNSAAAKAFKIANIPITIFLTNITIRSLASAMKQIQTPNFESAYSPVVTLQYYGSKTPLWLIHPGTGEILVFLGLAQYFPDRPIHALRPRGFNPGESPLIA